MIAGLITPQSIGLYDRDIVYKLLQLYKTSMRVSKIMLFFCTCFGFFIPFLLFYPNFSIIKIIFIVIPMSIAIMFWAHHLFKLLNNQTIYYCIIAYYLRIKIKSYNNIIEDNNRNNRKFSFIRKVVNNLNFVYLEINDYNNNFWSKYLFLFWISIVAMLSTAFNIAFTSKFISIKIFIIIDVTIGSLLLLFIIYISSAIYMEANKTYNLLNSYLNCFKNIPICDKLKVISLFNFG